MGAFSEAECLSKRTLFREGSLRRVLMEYLAHFHSERNHQGKGNVLRFPVPNDHGRCRRVECRKRLGGLLRYYSAQEYFDQNGFDPRLSECIRRQGRAVKNEKTGSPIKEGAGLTC